MAMFAAAEKFLARHLSGRFQETMPSDVSTRLGEISVDPRTVVLAKKVDSAAVGAPKPVHPLAAGSKNYAITIDMGGQTMSLAAKSVIAEQGDTFVVTDTLTTPQGEVSDVVTLDKTTLTVKSRAVKQGPIAIDLAFADGKVSGTMGMGGQSKPVSADVGGPIFGDGAGSYDVLATLPLKEGFSTTFRNFDVQKQKVSLKQLKVAAAEEVTVPAGTFKALKVEIASAEGEPGATTVWIAPDTRAVVKVSATVPSMGGAKVTSELQK
jgi:hypothetical protein